jgi:CO/xanthine dehydrogenase FAD-binding subunit
MKPAPFEYAAPNTVDEAVALLAKSDEDETKILAGGQSLMPLLNMRLARPKLLIDLSRVEDLAYIRETDGGLAIGAMATKRDLEDSELVKTRHGLLHASTVAIGHPQIRNRGTVGGSMAQADPAAEYPAVALALDIEMVATGPDGERVIPAEDFFITYLTTDLAPDEILTEVRVPELAAGTGWGFDELARRHGDFAMVGAVAVLRLEGGVATDTRIVLFGVADRAIRMPEAEACVNGQAPSAAVFARAGEAVGEAVEDPITDVHGGEEYRRDLARVLTRRVLAQAVERANG